MQIVIGAYGWQHEQWDKAFYPEDMPLEWRLNYYANEFETVLVPFSFWSNNEGAEFEDWAEDLPDGFRLFFEAGAEQKDQTVNKLLLDYAALNPPVNFSQIKYHKTPVLYGLQESIFNGAPSGQSTAVLLRIFAEDVINPEQIRQIIERAQEDYSKSEMIYLFFDQALANMNIINTANIIVDLLVAHD